MNYYKAWRVSWQGFFGRWKNVMFVDYERALDEYAILSRARIPSKLEQVESDYDGGHHIQLLEETREQ